MSVQARPEDYAAAIYDLALEAWTRQLVNVQKAMVTDTALRAALDGPGTSTEDKLERLAQALPERLDSGVRKFMGTLLEAGQVDQLDTILVEFDRLARHRPELRLAQVASAVPLTGDEQEAVRAKLADRFGADLEFQFEVDPSLIGGMHVRVGDQVIDGSVAGKLAALRDRLEA
ncbi:ATP synthase F1 subunit delta [Chloroflexota bacterium]